MLNNLPYRYTLYTPQPTFEYLINFHPLAIRYNFISNIISLINGLHVTCYPKDNILAL